LLDTLSVNTDHELPQAIFEVGKISLCDPQAETGATERARVAAGAIGPRVDYAQIRSSCEALLREFGWSIETQADQAALFIPGRVARVFARRADERREVGLIGEVHPEVLERFKLVQPTALFELDLDAL
jgi:phenylalanyl-tRNA synthetase beta chain